jgi:hypothetical protein
MRAFIKLTATLVVCFLGVVQVALAGTISGLTPSTVLACAGGNAAMFSYTESDPNASVTATSTNTGIATVTPTSMKGSGHFNVHGQSAGTTTISLSDGAGGAATENVTVNGPITVSPTFKTITFDGTNVNGTQAQTITVSDPGPATTVTATLSSGIALFSTGTTQAQTVTSGGAAQFTIVPVGSTTNAQQSATISFTDTSTCVSTSQNNVAVNVKPGSLAITNPSNNPLTLGFAGPTDVAKPIQGTDYNYAGTLSAALGSSTCTPDCGIATITGPTTAPGAANTFTYNVTPKKLGNGIVTVTGSTSQTVTIVVNGASITATGGSPVTFGTGGSISGAALSDITSTPITVSGALQTSSTGTGSVYIGTPGNIISGSGTLPISALSYNCSLVAGYDSGASLNGTQQLAANSIANPCMTFTSGQYSNLNFNLNLILNKNAANSLPAGTYTSANGFTLYISAT